MCIGERRLLTVNMSSTLKKTTRLTVPDAVSAVVSYHSVWMDVKTSFIHAQIVVSRSADGVGCDQESDRINEITTGQWTISYNIYIVVFINIVGSGSLIISIFL